jgi:hypothetical protein
MSNIGGGAAKFAYLSSGINMALIKVPNNIQYVFASILFVFLTTEKAAPGCEYPVQKPVDSLKVLTTLCRELNHHHFGGLTTSARVFNHDFSRI